MNTIDKLIVWLIVSITIIIGTYLTESPNCLWAFWIPFLAFS